METKAYKPSEVARMLGLSKEILLGYERAGKIPTPRRDSLGNRYYTSEEVEAIREMLGLRPRVGDRPKVLAVFNMKGGVGKSTVSSNLAWKMAEMGFRVLALDADPQGHMTTSLGREPSDFQKTLQHLLIPDMDRRISSVPEVRVEISPNLHLVPANLSMCSMNLLLFQQPEREYRLRRAVEKLRETDAYDLMIVDSPPAYDLTSLNIMLACDFLVSPVKLDGNSFYGLQYLFDAVRDLGATYRYRISRLVIVPNQYNHSYSVSRQILEGLQENYAPYLTRTVIRQDVSFDKANALREPIFVTAPSSKGSRDMEALTAEITDVIEARNSVEHERQEQRQA